MTQSRFRTCFISAPVGADTSVLRQAFEEAGVTWSDQTRVDTDASWVDAIDSALTASDFVCAVIPQGEQGNSLFELGIAYARGKPILAFVDSPNKLLSDILSLTYVRGDAKDIEAVTSSVKTFLEHAGDRRFRKSPGTKGKTGSRVKGPIHTAPPMREGFELERQTAALLLEAGFIVSSLSHGPDRGVDFAIWIDELQHSLGNPLLVEVKAGDLSVEQIHRAAAQLRTHVALTQGTSALLVYWDRANREYPSVSAEWPLVFQLSGSRLTQLVSDGRLSDELIRLRNAAVHRDV